LGRAPGWPMTDMQTAYTRLQIVWQMIMICV
jgi:hypothetical protein